MPDPNRPYRNDGHSGGGLDPSRPAEFDSMTSVYDELRSLAEGYMARERGDHTLQPTALVHEAYLRLSRSGVDGSDSRAFLGLAARVMRNVLVDHARRHRSAKRGGGEGRDVLHEGVGASDSSDSDSLDEVLALNAALDRLREIDERKARVVELRFFAGLTTEEIAELLGVSVRTVLYDSRAGCSWIRAELGEI